MSGELIYLFLIFSLLVIPRALQRFKIPAPLTCLLFGVAVMLYRGGQFHDEVIVMLGMLGISSLFLFAGLDVDLGIIRQQLVPLIVHLIIRCILLVIVAWLGWSFAKLPWQASGLFALALLTPSTGFIIDSLGRFGLDEDERLSVMNKAIAGEILALAALFVILQASNLGQMAMAGGVLLALLLGLPLFFVALGRWVVPHAPGSEFSLLVMVGFIAAFATYKLGVYYLVGAFVAGLIARLLRQRMPELASDLNLNAVRLFASFFVPFYFFKAGTSIPVKSLSFQALGVGVAMTSIVLPIRLLSILLQRRLLFQEERRASFRVAVALSPTLVFTLVLAGILRDRFGLNDSIFGGLVLYAVLTTLLPSLIFRAPFDINLTDFPNGGPSALRRSSDHQAYDPAIERRKSATTAQSAMPGSSTPALDSEQIPVNFPQSQQVKPPPDEPVAWP